MKRFVIIYTIASVFLLVIVTLIASYNHYLARIIDVYNEISEEAVTNQNFDDYVGIQSLYYKMISEEQVGDYQFSIYLSAGSNNEVSLTQLSIYVLPLHEVTYASAVDDANDQTNIIFTNDDESIIYALNEDDNFTGEAISYGIASIGFYYSAITLEDFKNIHIEVIDYNGNSIYQTSYDYQNQLDASDPLITLGFDETRLNELIDFNTYVRPQIVSNVGLFLIVDILLGTFIYFYRKKSKKL